MKILAVDSSSVTASVALVENENVVSEFFMNAGLTHSETLAPMVESVLKNSHTEAKDVDLYAVTTGPGSFTGLRIGASIVKGMAFALNKPCVAVSSLEALAYNSYSKNGLICACMDARCNQVYTALFEATGGEISRITEDKADMISDLADALKKIDKIVEFVGDGAQMCYNSIVGSGNEGKYFLAPQYNRYVQAHNIARLATRKYKSGEICSAEQLALNYLRIPQAQRQLNERLSEQRGGNL